MKKKEAGLILLILLCGILLRFYRLGSNPPSLDWDEASLGYNAYSLLKTGKDEYGNSWPVSIRSFNDYKPPLYTYLTIPSVAIFGLNEFAVRFPSALFGSLNVLLIYLVCKDLFVDLEITRKDKWSFLLPYLSAFLMAINPWHLQFSRVAFEANAALFFFSLAVYLLIKAIKQTNFFYYFSSLTTFVLTLYSYHSTRLTFPLFLILVFLLFHKQLIRLKAKLLILLIFALIFSLPLLIGTFRGLTQVRFSTVSVFTNPGIYTEHEEIISRQELFRKSDLGKQPISAILHNKWLVLSRIIARGYLDHFNPRFLFLQGDDNGRHSAVGSGLFYFWEIFSMSSGAYFFVKANGFAKKIMFSWLITAPIASALTTNTPHAVRALLMLPPLIVFSALGIVHLIEATRNRSILGIFGLIIVVNLIYYLDLYYVHTPIERSYDWQYGYKQLVEKVSRVENDFNQIIITTDYDQPYIYFLFYKQIDPNWYQTVSETGANGFGKYSFRRIEYQNDRQTAKRLLVAVSKEVPSDAAVFDKIFLLNGKLIFILIKT